MNISSNPGTGIMTAVTNYRIPNVYLLASIWFLTVAVLSWLWVREVPDIREPPQLKPKIPLIGHLLGIMQHEAEYFKKLSARQSWPIFTLKIFTSQIYVITSPELVQAVFRNSKSISFDPIASTGSQRIFAVPKYQMEMLERSPSDGRDSAMRITTKGMHTSMQPGESLLQMNSRALNCFSIFLNDIGTKGQPLNLYNWVRDHFILASAEALYGRVNPIAEDKSLIQSLEEFEASISPLFLNILPQFIARKGYQARLRFATAFKSYYARGLVKNAAGIIRGRYSDITAGGLTPADVGSFEIGIVMAATMNTVSGAFWLLCYLFSDPTLLEEVRAEISSIVTRTKGDGKEELRIAVSGLNRRCPLLVSVWQETMRLANVVVSSRAVLEDTLLNDTYLLKKGSVVQIPARIMHNDSSIWGPDADTFNGRRFLPSNTQKFTREQKKAQKIGFIPFGGGVVLCPGRHFATTEVLGVAAAMVMGCEMTMADGTGDLRVPSARKQTISVAVVQPEDEVEVLMKRRTGFENVSWAFDVGGAVGEEDMVF